jgi:hypothetical protein
MGTDGSGGTAQLSLPLQPFNLVVGVEPIAAFDPCDVLAIGWQIVPGGDRRAQRAEVNPFIAVDQRG